MLRAKKIQYATEDVARTPRRPDGPCRTSSLELRSWNVYNMPGRRLRFGRVVTRSGRIAAFVLPRNDAIVHKRGEADLMNRPVTKRSWKKELLGWGRTLLIGVALAFVLNHYIVANATVPTGSMENTIRPNDRILADRLAYLSSGPLRGDIVIFQPPDDPEGVPYVKRVIGLPGEVIEGRAGLVYVDGTPLNEPYVKEPLRFDFGPYTVPEDCYFMLGDNRNDSLDSRYWNQKFVLRGDIYGRVVLRYYPDFCIYDRYDPLQS